MKVADAGFDESTAAQMTASRLGLPVEVIELNVAPREAIERVPFLYGQPFADSSAVPSFFVARAARRRKVVLNGDGGDEDLRGVSPILGRPCRTGTRMALGSPVRAGLSSIGSKLAESTRRRSGIGFVSRTLRGLGHDDRNRYLTWTSDLLSNADLQRYFPDLAREESTVDRLSRLRDEHLSTLGLRAFQRSDFRLTLVDDLLVKMDIATMANSPSKRGRRSSTISTRRVRVVAAGEMAAVCVRDEAATARACATDAPSDSGHGTEARFRSSGCSLAVQRAP